MIQYKLFQCFSLFTENYCSSILDCNSWFLLADEYCLILNTIF